jgi:hypothetical protein
MQYYILYPKNGRHRGTYTFICFATSHPRPAPLLYDAAPNLIATAEIDRATSVCLHTGSGDAVVLACAYVHCVAYVFASD